MRFDNIGLWWEDVAKVKVKKEKVKRTPPEPTWLEPDYLPNLAEARAAQYDLMTMEELTAASLYQDPIVFDSECYPNYWLLAFKSVKTGKVLFFERYQGCDFDSSFLEWCLTNLLIVGFNSRSYDIPIITYAIHGATNEQLQLMTEEIIVLNERGDELLKDRKIKRYQKLNHIDLIELTALSPSLKKLAGRLNAPRMQELPFQPGSHLSWDQAVITKWYCVNDLDNTILLFNSLKEELEHRIALSKEYQIDLRSKSDAQIAEAVISAEVKKLKGVDRLQRTEIEPGTPFKFKMPRFIRFRSQGLSSIYNDVLNAIFIVNQNGGIDLPKELNNRTIDIAGTVYKLGIGGLHSQEKNICHKSDNEFILKDIDVTSYYPNLILGAGIYPRSMGPEFITVYSGLVEKRIIAKNAGNDIVAKGLKITVNGGYGKLGSVWSMLYSPDLLIQVTVTGQLALLMLIERLEWERIHVVSANTDGIVVKCPRHREAECDVIVKQWEIDTNLKTEENQYKVLASRDVNNYIAVYQTPQKGKDAKTKGIFGDDSRKREINPVNTICSKALVECMAHGTPIEKTIGECKDITKFLTVRRVNGGGVKDGEYLGKEIRWYNAVGIEGEIVYAKSGNRVPRSNEGAKPCLLLPDSFPDDVNIDWYITETYKMLEELNYVA